MKAVISLSVLSLVLQVVAFARSDAVEDACSQTNAARCSDSSQNGNPSSEAVSSSCTQPNLILTDGFQSNAEMMNEQAGSMPICLRPERCRPMCKTDFLAVLENLLNLPKGAMGKIPLCSTKDLYPNSACLKGNVPTCSLSIGQLKNLLALLTPKGGTPPHILPYPFIPGVVKPTPPIFIPPRPPICPPQLPCDCSGGGGGGGGGGIPPNIPVYPCSPDGVCRNFPVCPNGEINTVRQVPVVQKIMRSVIETRTKHIPVIKKRLRTVVEPYTSHVPVLEKFARPIEDTIIRTIPVYEKRCKPIIGQGWPNFQFGNQQLSVNLPGKQLIDTSDYYCPSNSPTDNKCIPPSAPSEWSDSIFPFPSDNSPPQLSPNLPNLIQQISPSNLRCPNPCVSFK